MTQVLVPVHLPPVLRTRMRRLLQVRGRLLGRLAALALVAFPAACSMVSGPAAPVPQPQTPRSGRETSGVVPSARPGQPAAGYTAIPLPREVRGLWVVRTTLVHPDSLRVMVERAASAGFNTLLVQVRGRGDAYYRSRWEPRPDALGDESPEFDPLALVIREAHSRGLAVHAWVNTHLVGSSWGIPSAPEHLVVRRPDLLAVPRALARELFDTPPTDPGYAEALLQYAQERPDGIEGLYTSPSSPEVKEHIYSLWMDLTESYELDGIHFDYIRYPNPDFDYSRGALERFRAWVSPRLRAERRAELEEAYRIDPLAYVDALPEAWGEFRRAQITDLVERIYYGVKKRRPDLVVSAAVLANAEDAYESRFQDWRGWLAAGILDAVAPMAYTPQDSVFEAQIQDAVAVAGGDRVWAGIGAYQNTFQGTLDKIRIARRLGTRGVVLFSYDWAVSQGESDGGQSLLDRVGAAVFRRR